MLKTFLPFSVPSIGDEEIAEVIDTLRSGWLTTGPKTRRFEQEFATLVGAPDALAVNSCTAALHVGLAAIGIGPGDLVITTPMTFCSSVHVIEHVGARPILVDVEPDTLNISPWQVQQVLERFNGRSAHGGDLGGTRAKVQPEGSIKAIQAVHLYGHPCDLDWLKELAQDFGLALIEDAAHALPATYKGHMVGSYLSSRGSASPELVNVTAFSFYATKNLTTAEGGMLTGTPEVVERARIWSLHGMSQDAWNRYSVGGSWRYEVLLPGFKYNMTDIQAALGLQQLRKLTMFQARRREIVRRYTEAFLQHETLEPPMERVDIVHAWHIYALRLRLETLSIGRQQFIDELNARGVGTSVHFIPIHLHQHYSGRYGFRPDDFPIAYREYKRLVSLPLYPSMTNADVDHVIESVIDIATSKRR